MQGHASWLNGKSNVESFSPRFSVIFIVFITVSTCVLALCEVLVFWRDVNVFNIHVTLNLMLCLPTLHRIKQLPMACREEAVLTVNPGDSVQNLIDPCVALHPSFLSLMRRLLLVMLRKRFRIYVRDAGEPWVVSHRWVHLTNRERLMLFRVELMAKVIYRGERVHVWYDTRALWLLRYALLLLRRFNVSS